MQRPVRITKTSPPALTLIRVQPSETAKRGRGLVSFLDDLANECAAHRRAPRRVRPNRYLDRLMAVVDARVASFAEQVTR